MADTPDGHIQEGQTTQDIIKQIRRLLEQNVELTIREIASSLGKSDVDAGPILSHPRVRRDLNALERQISGFIEINEEMLRRPLEDLIAPEIAQERQRLSNEAQKAPSPEWLHGYEEANPDVRRLLESQSAEESDDGSRQQKSQYFFYGSLMDPGCLRRVISLPRGASPPRMRPAHVVGFATRLWGPYPALVETGRPEDVVRGVACEIEGVQKDVKRRLAAYEGNSYAETDVGVCLDSPDGTGEHIRGTTFKWVDSEDDLVDGKFDLQEWMAS